MGTPIYEKLTWLNHEFNLGDGSTKTFPNALWGELCSIYNNLKSKDEKIRWLKKVELKDDPNTIKAQITGTARLWSNDKASLWVCNSDFNQKNPPLNPRENTARLLKEYFKKNIPDIEWEAIWFCSELTFEEFKDKILDLVKSHDESKKIHPDTPYLIDIGLCHKDLIQDKDKLKNIMESFVGLWITYRHNVISQNLKNRSILRKLLHVWYDENSDTYRFKHYNHQDETEKKVHYFHGSVVVLITKDIQDSIIQTVSMIGSGGSTPRTRTLSFKIETGNRGAQQLYKIGHLSSFQYKSGDPFGATFIMLKCKVDNFDNPAIETVSQHFPEDLRMPGKAGNLLGDYENTTKYQNILDVDFIGKIGDNASSKFIYDWLSNVPLSEKMAVCIKSTDYFNESFQAEKIYTKWTFVPNSKIYKNL